MKKTLVAALLGAFLAGQAAAADYQVGDLTISGPFARATAGRAKTGIGYLTIDNKGEADRLIAASAPVSGSTVLHTHIRDGDIMRMRKVEDIKVAANGQTTLEPGGFHIMFIDLHGPLKKGDAFPVELTFEKTGKVTVEMDVGSIGASRPPKE